MAGFRRIVTASLLMLQVLSCTAVTFSYFTVRAGDEVALHCGNVTPDQDECDRTVWLFIGSVKTETLFEYGKIHKDAEDKSDRLSVSEKCSLVIKNVTDEDVGQYTCRQFRSGRQEGADALSVLSVVTLTEHKNTDEVTLICSVKTHYQCRHIVKWVYEGDETDVMTSQLTCSAQLSINKSHLDQKSYELLKCEVTDHYSKEVHQFPFSPPPSSGDATKPTTTIPSASTTRNNPEVTNSKTSGNNSDGKNPESWGRSLIYVSVAVASLLITTVTVVSCKRCKGKKTKTVEDAADPEEGVFYASVSYTKKTDGAAQARIQRDDDEDDEGDSVTYSTVNPRSSSAAASVDPGDLYASVHKPN